MFGQYSLDKNALKKASLADGFGSDFVISVTRLNQDRLVCVHDIANGLIGAPKPIDKAAFRSLVAEACSDAPVEHWKSSRVLYESGRVLAWYRPASSKKETLWYRYGNINACLRVKFPTLVFVACGQQLQVYASASNKVTPSTRLYHAPFGNTYENGTLCFGSATKPEPNDPLTVKMQKYEAALLETCFSHINCQKTFKALLDKKHGTEDHVAIWREFEQSEQKPRGSDLVLTGKRLRDVVEKLEDKR